MADTTDREVNELVLLAQQRGVGRNLAELQAQQREDGKREVYSMVHLERLIRYQTSTRYRGGKVLCTEVHGVNCTECSSCHFCRQKTIGDKTFCQCASKTSQIGGPNRGVWCGGCLQDRIGENLDHVLPLCEQGRWRCPACRNICNCSGKSCQRSHHGLRPTKQLAAEAFKLGYPSVAHYLILNHLSMDATGHAPMLDDGTAAPAHRQPTAGRAAAAAAGDQRNAAMPAAGPTARRRGRSSALVLKAREVLQACQHALAAPNLSALLAERGMGVDILNAGLDDDDDDGSPSPAGLPTPQTFSLLQSSAPFAGAPGGAASNMPSRRRSGSIGAGPSAAAGCTRAAGIPRSSAAGSVGPGRGRQSAAAAAAGGLASPAAAATSVGLGNAADGAPDWWPGDFGVLGIEPLRSSAGPPEPAEQGDVPAAATCPGGLEAGAAAAAAAAAACGRAAADAAAPHNAHVPTGSGQNVQSSCAQSRGGQQLGLRPSAAETPKMPHRQQQWQQQPTEADASFGAGDLPGADAPGYGADRQPHSSERQLSGRARLQASGRYSRMQQVGSRYPSLYGRSAGVAASRGAQRRSPAAAGGSDGMSVPQIGRMSPAVHVRNEAEPAAKRARPSQEGPGAATAGRDDFTVTGSVEPQQGTGGLRGSAAAAGGPGGDAGQGGSNPKMPQPARADSFAEAEQCEDQHCSHHNQQQQQCPDPVDDASEDPEGVYVLQPGGDPPDIRALNEILAAQQLHNELLDVAGPGIDDPNDNCNITVQLAKALMDRDFLLNPEFDQPVVVNHLKGVEEGSHTKLSEDCSKLLKLATLLPMSDVLDSVAPRLTCQEPFLDFERSDPRARAMLLDAGIQLLRTLVKHVDLIAALDAAAAAAGAAPMAAQQLACSALQISDAAAEAMLVVLEWLLGCIKQLHEEVVSIMAFAQGSLLGDVAIGPIRFQPVHAASLPSAAEGGTHRQGLQQQQQDARLERQDLMELLADADENQLVLLVQNLTELSQYLPRQAAAKMLDEPIMAQLLDLNVNYTAEGRKAFLLLISTLITQASPDLQQHEYWYIENTEHMKQLLQQRPPQQPPSSRQELVDQASDALWHVLQPLPPATRLHEVQQLEAVVSRHLLLPLELLVAGDYKMRESWVHDKFPLGAQQLSQQLGPLEAERRAAHCLQLGTTKVEALAVMYALQLQAGSISWPEWERQVVAPASSLNSMLHSNSDSRHRHFQVFLAAQVVKMCPSLLQCVAAGAAAHAAAAGTPGAAGTATSCSMPAIWLVQLWLQSMFDVHSRKAFALCMQHVTCTLASTAATAPLFVRAGSEHWLPQPEQLYSLLACDPDGSNRGTLVASVVHAVADGAAAAAGSPSAAAGMAAGVRPQGLQDLRELVSGLQHALDARQLELKAMDQPGKLLRWQCTCMPGLLLLVELVGQSESSSTSSAVGMGYRGNRGASALPLSEVLKRFMDLAGAWLRAGFEAVVALGTARGGGSSTYLGHQAKALVQETGSALFHLQRFLGVLVNLAGRGWCLDDIDTSKWPAGASFDGQALRQLITSRPVAALGANSQGSMLRPPQKRSLSCLQGLLDAILQLLSGHDNLPAHEELLVDHVALGLVRLSGLTGATKPGYSSPGLLHLVLGSHMRLVLEKAVQHPGPLFIHRCVNALHLIRVLLRQPGMQQEYSQRVLLPCLARPMLDLAAAPPAVQYQVYRVLHQLIKGPLGQQLQLDAGADEVLAASGGGAPVSFSDGPLRNMTAISQVQVHQLLWALLKTSLRACLALATAEAGQQGADAVRQFEQQQRQAMPGSVAAQPWLPLTKTDAELQSLRSQMARMLGPPPPSLVARQTTFHVPAAAAPRPADYSWTLLGQALDFCRGMAKLKGRMQEAVQHIVPCLQQLMALHRYDKARVGTYVLQPLMQAYKAVLAEFPQEQQEQWKLPTVPPAAPPGRPGLQQQQQQQKQQQHPPGIRSVLPQQQQMSTGAGQARPLQQKQPPQPQQPPRQQCAPSSSQACSVAPAGQQHACAIGAGGSVVHARVKVPLASQAFSQDGGMAASCAVVLSTHEKQLPLIQQRAARRSTGAAAKPPAGPLQRSGSGCSSSGSMEGDSGCCNSKPSSASQQKRQHGNSSSQQQMQSEELQQRQQLKKQRCSSGSQQQTQPQPQQQQQQQGLQQRQQLKQRASQSLEQEQQDVRSLDQSLQQTPNQQPGSKERAPSSQDKHQKVGQLIGEVARCDKKNQSSQSQGDALRYKLVLKIPFPASVDGATHVEVSLEGTLALRAKCFMEAGLLQEGKLVGISNVQWIPCHGSRQKKKNVFAPTHSSQLFVQPDAAAAAACIGVDADYRKWWVECYHQYQQEMKKICKRQASQQASQSQQQPSKSQSCQQPIVKQEQQRRQQQQQHQQPGPPRPQQQARQTSSQPDQLPQLRLPSQQHQQQPEAQSGQQRAQRPLPQPEEQQQQQHTHQPSLQQQQQHSPHTEQQQEQHIQQPLPQQQQQQQQLGPAPCPQQGQGAQPCQGPHLLEEQGIPVDAVDEGPGQQHATAARLLESLREPTLNGIAGNSLLQPSQTETMAWEDSQATAKYLTLDS